MSAAIQVIDKVQSLEWVDCLFARWLIEVNDVG